MRGEAFDWLEPSPLWPAGADSFRRPGFFQPQLLEFRGDNFMDEFFALAGARDPERLREALVKPGDGGRPPKLFQPVHGRFYLVCGTLCCRVPGFPDREVRRGEREETFFVLRKVEGQAEFGWVAGREGAGWVSLGGQTRRVLPGEEALPLFSAPAGNGRPVLFGYIPVASRETFAAAPTESPVDFTTDPRVEELAARFREPAEMLAGLEGNPPVLRLSVYILLDLADYLASHLPAVAEALGGGPEPAAPAEKALLDFLRQEKLGTLPLADALATVSRHRAELNALGEGDLPSAFTADFNLTSASLDFGGLSDRVRLALPVARPPVLVPKLAATADTRYLLRCVYRRPQCDPVQAWVSQGSLAFELAAFADPDAPARPIRITLPADASLAGLRKMPKGVSFLMSAAFRNKMARITGKEKELFKDGGSAGNEGSFAGGHLCAFSIQILFIIAFVLMIVMAILLNLVFFWLPFLKICLPLKPSFK